MPLMETLRALVQQRLTAAVEDILELFEKTITEYEEERNLLHGVFKPKVRIQRADMQPPLDSKEETFPVPQCPGRGWQRVQSPGMEQQQVQQLSLEQQQDWSRDLKRRHVQNLSAEGQRAQSLGVEQLGNQRLERLEEKSPGPVLAPVRLTHIKEELRQPGSSFGGEQLQGLDEVNIIQFTCTKKEEDEEETQSPQLHQDDIVKIEVGEEDCGGADAASSSDPDHFVRGDPEHSDFYQADINDSCAWEEREEAQSALNPLQDQKAPAAHQQHQPGKIRKKQQQVGQSGTSFCPICHEYFPQEVDLMSHMSVHTGEKPFKCSICGKRYSDEGSVKRHLKLHSKNAPLSRKDSLLKNMLPSQKRDKPYSSFYGRSYKPFSSLTSHRAIHNRGKHYSCSVCKKTFQHPFWFERHMSVHTGEKPYSCSVCGKNFRTSSTLYSHMSAIHTEQKPYSCSVCNRHFRLKGVLLMHMRIHTGEKPYSCDICGKRFPRSTALKDHIVTHTGERPFSCSICKASFKYRTSLRVHETTHTENPPHRCSDCGKAFTQNSYLKRHSRVHTGERPFKCSVCGKSYTSRSGWVKHTEAHTRTFCCTFCNEVFPTWRRLKHHKCVAKVSTNEATVSGLSAVASGPLSLANEPPPFASGLLRVANGPVVVDENSLDGVENLLQMCEFNGPPQYGVPSDEMF